LAAAIAETATVVPKSDNEFTSLPVHEIGKPYIWARYGTKNTTND